jgi:RHS repeat-associated protein
MPVYEPSRNLSMCTMQTAYIYDDVPRCASQFTGKERDTETGLDYFGARYYASNMGRWMSPDWSSSPEAVPYATLSNPQSLNLYSYVGNNPMSTADADGHCCSDWADWIDSKVQVARDFYTPSANDSHAMAATKTFVGGFSGDVTSGAGDVFRLGNGTAAAIDNVKQGDYLAAAANLSQDGCRVGQVILTGTAVAAKVSPSVNAQEVSAKAGTNSVETSAGRVDLQGDAHYSKAAGKDINTPHVHENGVNVDPQGNAHPYQSRVPRPATNADVNAAAKAAGVRITPKPLPVKPKPENQ